MGTLTLDPQPENLVQSNGHMLFINRDSYIDQSGEFRKECAGDVMPESEPKDAFYLFVFETEAQLAHVLASVRSRLTDGATADAEVYKDQAASLGYLNRPALACCVGMLDLPSHRWKLSRAELPASVVKLFPPQTD
jgi:hypothetical protein